MLQVKQDTTRIKRENKTTSKLEFDKGGNGKKCKVEKISNSAIYAEKSKNHLLSLYYLVL